MILLPAVQDAGRSCVRIEEGFAYAWFDARLALAVPQDYRAR
ncbi:MAG: hypothetical protein ACI9HH_002784, partial [Pseudomonadota bacterium]